MSIVMFRLSSLTAMWRDYRAASNDFSASLPSPTMIAGLLGNVQGMDYDPGVAYRTGNPMPYARSLLDWVEREQVGVAVRWLGGRVKRISIDGNRTKVLNSRAKWLPTQVPRQFLWKPQYEIAVRLLTEDASSRLAVALNCPVRRPHAGINDCPAFVADVRVVEVLPVANWAIASSVPERDSVPLTQMRLDDRDERMDVNGYWGLPFVGEPEGGDERFVPVMVTRKEIQA